MESNEMGSKEMDRKVGWKQKIIAARGWTVSDGGSKGVDSKGGMITSGTAARGTAVTGMIAWGVTARCAARGPQQGLITARGVAAKDRRKGGGSKGA